MLSGPAVAGGGGGGAWKPQGHRLHQEGRMSDECEGNIWSVCSRENRKDQAARNEGMEECMGSSENVAGWSEEASKRCY